MRSLTTTLTNPPASLDPFPGVGRLQDFNVPQLLKALRVQRSTSILTLKSPRSGTYQLYFNDGDLVAATSDREELRLGRFFFRSGAITVEQLYDALSQVNRDHRLGEVLLSRGFVGEDDCTRLLEQQFREVVLSASLLREGVFVYEPQDGIFADNLQLFIDHDELIARCASHYEELAILLHSFSDLPRQVRRLSREPQRELRQEQVSLLLLLSRPTQVLELLDKAEDEPLLALFFLQRLIEQQYVEEVAPPQAASTPLVLPVAAKDIPSPPEDPPSSTSIDSWSAGPYSFTQELDLALVGPDAADDDALDGTVRIQALPVQPTGQDPTTEITLEDLSSALPEDAASTDSAETADAEQSTVAEGNLESPRDFTTSSDTEDGAPTGGLDSENDRVASYDSPPIGPSEEARARLQVTTPVDDDKNTLLHSAMQDRSLPFQRPADPNAGVFFSAHSVLDVVDLRHITQFSVATDIPLDGIVEAAGAEDDESHFAGADDGSSDEHDEHDEHDADEHDASEEEADSEASEPEEEAPVHTDDELQLTHGDTGFDPELAAALLRAAAQAETELRRPLPPGTSPSSTDLHDLGFSRLLGENDAEVEEVEDLRPENVVSRPSAAPTVLLRRTELQRMAQEHSNLSIVDEDEPEDLDDVLQLGATVVIPRDEANALLAKDPGSSPASPSGQAPSNPTESAAGRPAGSSQDDEMSQSERDILRSISDIFPQNEAGTGHERKARRNQTGEQPTAYLSRSMNHALKATLRHRTDIYNRIFSVIFSHFQARLGREQAITRFQAFFNHRDRSYPELFIDLAFRADGTLDQELLLKNLEVYPTPRPAEVLDASLNEVFYFLLRDIHLLLNPEEQSEMMDAVVQVRNLLYKRTSQP